MLTAPTGSRHTTRPAAQQPSWIDPVTLHRVIDDLEKQPPLVEPREVDRLHEMLGRAATGRALLLQGGHCAETFGEQALDEVENNVRTLGRMGRAFSHETGLPVVPVGRMAGQYAKPRSRPTETRGEVELPSYRGDAVNGAEFNERDRTPDPWRMRTVYDQSAAALERIPDGMCHVSHEALLLDYENALVRIDPETGRRYSGSGHMLWIGERTRQLDGAHVEFAAGVDNPIGVKVGPSATAEQLLGLIELLDPERRPGRLTFIIRMGAERITDTFPELVERVASSGSPALWVCDPMHGNTRTAANGLKTRWISEIAAEIHTFVRIHRALGTHPGGLHLELTGSRVTECVGGFEPITSEALGNHYTSACDPRLNRDQSLELARLSADMWSRN
ncbi:3-deoxy-7-phosphoheptulonate synthase [Actinopolyspora saharensis]|uniref:Phospho-2-dehydro-3-deoxyheptonate aldolase n=1 Tax=Actinopolyspora saharensis TaxID=995062 RepID=A0A1H1FBK8_9ACTN|nr:3-deoxy-7-phosphoheptulonate synthase [Actinopolyspora saharensis]SDQ98290.1 3-deoxy-D-arabinoheptulosonate-7-phosphate synthase [Actinopolyspora saharensis]